MKRVMLYFGSFNPVHNGHIALAEWVIEQGLCDEVALIVSPQSPYKQTIALAPEMERFEMAEIACAVSRYGEKIKPSCVEFLLPKPSYTIDTLRYLSDNHRDINFSILMGGDQIAELDGWKEYEKVLEYPVFVYPRCGASTERFAGRFTLLENAPPIDISSTEIRRRIAFGEDISAMIAPEVAKYIVRKGLWSAEAYGEDLTAYLAARPEDAALYLERGKLYFHLGEWGDALNDFNRTIELDGSNNEAQQLADMVCEILEFRYKDIYNP